MMSDQSSSPSAIGVPAADPGSTKPRSFSFVRVFLAVLLIATSGVAGGFIALRVSENRTDSSAPQWFAPYVDVTLTPTYEFQDPGTNDSLNVVLSFIVGSKNDGCSPSWGATYSLDEADQQLDLERRIVRQRQRGGDVIVSFGGAINQELAVACTNLETLTAAYAEVVNHYDLSLIDLDLEGTTLANVTANTRRAEALAAVQKARRDAGEDLAIWLTLPVAPDGLDSEAVATIDATLAGGVDLAGVNLLTMDYGSSRRSSVSFVDASTAAADSAFEVLNRAYRRAGVSLTSAEVWQRIGMTPMIGQNDTIADRLDIEGARALHKWSRSRGVGRMSMWSANRDTACGGNILDTVVNNNCSGVDQEPGQFAAVLGASAIEISTELATTAASPEQRGAQADPSEVASNDNLPYDEWRKRREYDIDEKVVWDGVVYEAKWWTVGDPPDAIVDHDWDSPWRVLGPVLDDEPPLPPPVTIPPNTFPTWNVESTYYAGDRVQLDGLGFKAKWWTRGDIPTAEPDNEWENPWEPIDSASIVVTSK
ncbi:MAG: glycosyl hydrolase family 18 [Actinobacteria bacterium]|nr:glycosyl hydrolase family 18 [Actinomycetota bacterium]